MDSFFFFAASSFAWGFNILSQPPQHLPGRASEPKQGQGEPWGYRAPHTQFPPKNLLSLPQALAFLAELHRRPSKAPRLKSAVWSMVITSECLTPRGRGGHCNGWERKPAELTHTPNLFPVMVWYPPPPVHCSQHAGSAPCPCAHLRNSWWSYVSPEKRPISTHSTRSVQL